MRVPLVHSKCPLCSRYLEKCATDALKEGRQEDVYDDLMKVIFKLAR